MTGVKVLICGGRNLNSTEVWNTLEKDLKTVLPSGIQIAKIIHGGARGADEGAAQWAESEGIKVTEYKAEWKKHGKAAGPIRNQKMIDMDRPDYVVAFPGGRGTDDMISRADLEGIPVIRIGL